MIAAVKTCYFVGSSKRVISAMPADVKTSFGNAFYIAQVVVRLKDAEALHRHHLRGEK
jgi:hypothetical protein